MAASSERRRGFGSFRSISSSGHTSHKYNKYILPTTHSRPSHRQLYEDHVLPLLSAGRLIDAEPVLNLLYQAHTSIPEVYRCLMTIAELRGDHKLVDIYCQQWLTYPSLNINNLREQAREAQRRCFYDLALPLCLALLKHLPEDVEFIGSAACLFIREERFDNAIDLLCKVDSLVLNLNAYLLLLNAICDYELRFLADAARLANLSLAIEPSALAHVVLAAIFDEQAMEAKVLAHLEDSNNCSFKVSFSPWLIPRFSAPIYSKRNDFAHAKQLLDLALIEQPTSQILKYQLGELLLMQGNLSAGFSLWAKLDKVRIIKGISVNLPYYQDLLNPNPDDTLLLVANGTLGDTLLFSRYFFWLVVCKQLPVKLFVQLPLLNFLRNSFSESSQVLPISELQFERKGNVLSLLAAPGVFGACDQIPFLQKPCLKIDPHLVEFWQSYLNITPGQQIIAINWNGSAMHSLSESISSDIPLECFSPLTDLPNCRLVSLQKGYGSNQLTNCSFLDSFVECQPLISNENRFEWMAALVSICNWVVCDDSGPAHLAASLNVPTILLANPRLGWRWKGVHNNSFWYPSVKVIQDINLNWKSSVQNACNVIRDAKLL